MFVINRHLLLIKGPPSAAPSVSRYLFINWGPAMMQY